MNKLLILLLLIMLSTSLTTTAQNIQLPEPAKSGGKQILDAINSRKSDREFIDKQLDLKQLSTLLWCAYGFNRDQMRVVPSAMNKQEFTVYVTLKEGTYQYEPAKNLLIHKAAGDNRAKTGEQDYVATAGLNLIYVATIEEGDVQSAYSDCGFISQNVYLYCASEGLGTVVRGYFDQQKLKDLLKLTGNQSVILCQSVGYVK